MEENNAQRVVFCVRYSSVGKEMLTDIIVRHKSGTPTTRKDSLSAGQGRREEGYPMLHFHWCRQRCRALVCLFMPSCSLGEEACFSVWHA